MNRHLDELRRKLPGLGRKADYENSRQAAIDLACLECTVGARAAIADCGCPACPLWPFRPYGDNRTRPDGVVPTLEQYRSWSEGRGSGNAEHLAAYRAQRGAGEPGPEPEAEPEPEAARLRDLARALEGLK